MKPEKGFNGDCTLQGPQNLEPLGDRKKPRIKLYRGIIGIFIGIFTGTPLFALGWNFAPKQNLWGILTLPRTVNTCAQGSPDDIPMISRSSPAPAPRPAP